MADHGHSHACVTSSFVPLSAAAPHRRPLLSHSSRGGNHGHAHADEHHGHAHADEHHGHAHGVAGLSALLGDILVSKSGGEVATSEALAGTAYVLVYCSAHWCPPCRAFTPALSEWVARNAERLNLKCVFASSDRDEGAYSAYFKEMSWDLALPWEDEHVQRLMKAHGVRGIPTLLVFDGSGHLVTKEGRDGVSSDPDGARFPWKSAGGAAAAEESSGCTLA